MEIDRRAFLASLGSVALVESMDPEAKAEALEHYMSDLLDAAVAGEQESLNMDNLTIEGDETGMTVSDGKVTANVICGNVPTANATVYIIDAVLAGAK